VVEGIRRPVGSFAGIYEIEGVKMLELAMPIEPGNSGGPVLTDDGQIVGLVTMKSTVKNGVGYAMPSNLIRQMIDEPNPIPMSRWKTIGALDARMWKPVFGGDWKRKAARIVVSGVGTSFGGRTLCLQQVPRPEFPFDLKVDVKLGDEQGAAGLVFHSDGGDRHYGFYPSAGNMRLTRFDGPDVGSWTILHNEPHPAYRPDDWNSLLVRIHADHFECFLNGQKVVESRDDAVPHGAIGLAAFRGTLAEFRRFQTGADLFPTPLNEEQKLAVNEIIGRISPNHPAGADAAASVIPFGDQAAHTLSAEADRMEKKAKRLRELAVDVHESVIRTQLKNVLGVTDDSKNDPNDAAQDGDVSLLHAALLISRMDNPDVDVDVYLERIKLWADEIQSTLPKMRTKRLG
jgi:serine protease Do